VPYRQLPAEVCLRGAKLHGILGPVFLGSWISVAALTNARGRRLLVAAALCAFPFLHTPEIRYLIPALPFLSLAFGMALCLRAWIAVAAVALHAALSWPSVMALYCDPGAWRIGEIPWAVAFRIAPEGPYIASSLGDSYAMAASAQNVLDRGETVFAFSGLPRSYVDQNIIVAWESAFGERMQDALYCAMFYETQPLRWLQYTFPQKTTQKIRLVQKARSGSQHWSIGELRLYHGETELNSDAGWRLSANPNRWDATLAFDRNRATRWSTWRPFQPDMFYEIDFGGPVTIDRVVAESAPEQSDSRMRVEIWNGSGWADAGVDASIEDVAHDPAWRRAAIQELKRNGLRWMLINKSDWGAEYLYLDPALWGIRRKIATQHFMLFYLE
jgi:hypothetical protein